MRLTLKSKMVASTGGTANLNGTGASRRDVPAFPEAVPICSGIHGGDDLNPASQRKPLGRGDVQAPLGGAHPETPAAKGINVHVKACIPERLLRQGRRAQLADGYFAVRGVALKRHPKRQAEAAAGIQLQLAFGVTGESIGPPGIAHHTRNHIR
jgi:hypothetical protein